jgi:3-hydroxybutyryl-CoA dehydratase
MWTPTNKSLWDAWLALMQPAQSTRPSAWQQSLHVWQHSLQRTLEAQAACATIWTEYLAALGPRPALPPTPTPPIPNVPRHVPSEPAPAAPPAPVIARQFVVGDSASFTKRIGDDDVVRFAELSGDTNPVHLDDTYAERTRFGQRIAHGVLALGLVSAVLGTQLPGPGAIYLSQTIKFSRPVYVGDEITAKVTIKEVRQDKPILTLDTVCTNGRGERVLAGEAVILYEPVA